MNLAQEGGALRQLITVIDELRDVGLSQYISLPRIAAIGTQSSGKSSVIESIVGMDFLPRGGGVVTRRPLELRLVHLNSQEHKGEVAWAVFEKLGTKKFTDFNEVRLEIERQTDEVAGKNKGIVNDPILLTVYATGAPDLTLIDLPGITRVAVAGSDQTQDIEKATRDMTMHYVGDPRTIILAVLPANQDMSVSDALQIGRLVDPQGLRTIGVVTKIDIMDQGTDAVKMLRGEDIPLRMGYVGVKMRTQQDILDNKPVKKQLEDEKTWFESHKTYSKLPPGSVGLPVLTDKLTTILFKHIRRFLPEIKNEINERRRSVQDRLDELGSGVPVSDVERNQVVWTLITDYCEMFKNTISGKYDRKLQRYLKNLPSANAEQMKSGGATIRGIHQDFLIDLTGDISQDMSDEDIDRAIRMHEGDSLPGFPSPDTFEFLALPYLQQISIPSVECVHNVASALDLLAQRMSQAVFRRFPGLAEVALEMTQNIIQREKEFAKVIVEQQVAAHTGYLFTNDDDYLTKHGSMEPMYKGGNKAPPPQQPEAPKEPGVFEKTSASVRDGASGAYKGAQNMAGISKTDQARRQARYSGPFVAEIRKRLDCYFHITIKAVRDSVPQAIGQYLIRAVQDKLQYELLNELNQKERAEALLGEPPHIMEERRALASQLEVLVKAINVLTRDPALASLAFEAELDDEPAPAPAPAQQTRAAPAPTPAPAPAAPQRAPAAAAAAPPPAGGNSAAQLFGGGAAPKAGGGLFGEPKPKNSLFD